jgi:hypothetical protein
MTESQQTAAPSRTDAASCPDCSKLLEFADCDEAMANGTASTEQAKRFAALAFELSGGKLNGEAVSSVLARQLAEERHRVQFTQLVAEREEPGSERLQKDPTLAILPSGNAISVANILEARFVPVTGSLFVLHQDGMEPVRIDDAADVAALRAALLNIGVAINAPTIAGEDRDGDGRTGE